MYDQSCYDLARSFLLDAPEKKWNEQTVSTIAQAIQDTIEEAINDLDDEEDEGIVDHILKPLMNEQETNGKL